MSIKKIFAILFLSAFLLGLPTSVWASSSNVSIYLDKATNYYGIDPPRPDMPAIHYYDQDVTLVALNNREKNYNIQVPNYNNKDISFTDISSTQLPDMSSCTNGCNASLTIDLGFAFYCSTTAGTDYCGLNTESTLPLNSSDFTIARNYGFASYVMQHLQLVYKNKNGDYYAQDLITSDIITFGVGRVSLYTGTHTYNATVDTADFFEFVGIRVNYDATLLDWIPSSVSNNLLSVTLLNNIAVNYNNDGYGVTPPMPAPDKSLDPNWYLFNDTYNPNKQNNIFGSIQNQFTENNVVSSLLLLPVALYQKIINVGFSNQCSSFSLGTWFGTEISLPCINLSTILGSTLWGTIDVICTAILLLGIRKKFVDIFNDMTSLKDRGNQIE